MLSPDGIFPTPQSVALEVPLSMGFSWQEYWSGLPFPSPGDLPNPGLEPGSQAIANQAISLLCFFLHSVKVFSLALVGEMILTTSN